MIDECTIELKNRYQRMVRAVDAVHVVRYVLQLGAVPPATPMMQPRAFTSSMLPRTLSYTASR
jgi:hypothetical protein